MTVTAGDVNDYVPYLAQIEHIHHHVIPIQTATADAAYDFPLAHRVLDDLGAAFFVRPRSSHDVVQTNLQKDVFTYDAAHDVYICPNGKQLRLAFLQRGAGGLIWLYRPENEDCLSCHMKEMCMTNRQKVRTVRHSCFQTSVQKNLSRRTEPAYKDAFRKRQIWCEGTFAAQKRCHNLRAVFR